MSNKHVMQNLPIFSKYKICKFCRFFKESKLSSECHRYPPAQEMRFPIVQAAFWCGEWQEETNEYKKLKRIF